MIDHEKVTFEFLDCDEREKEILTKYWHCNSEGKFPILLTKIQKEYNIKPQILDSLAMRKTKVIWDHGTCECGNVISQTVLKRTQLQNLIYGSVSYPKQPQDKKCDNCNERQRNIEELEYLNSQPSQEIYHGFYFKDTANDSIRTTIKSLNPMELKLLYQIYEIKNFYLIKNSAEIIPVKFGTINKAVYRAFYKFQNLNLVDLQTEGNSYITDMVFKSEIEELLIQMKDELTPFLNQFDLELAMIRFTEGYKVKYITELKPQSDIILKAGQTYNFIGTIAEDENLILRVINAGSISGTKAIPKFEKTDEEDSDDSVPF